MSYSGVQKRLHKKISHALMIRLCAPARVSLASVALGAMAAVWVSFPLKAEDIVTASGVIYREAVITKVEPDGIRIRHSDGVGKIYFRDLPLQIQQQYGYDPVRAKEYSEKTARQQLRAALYRKMLEQQNPVYMRVKIEVAEIHPTGVVAFATGWQERRVTYSVKSSDFGPNPLDGSPRVRFKDIDSTLIEPYHIGLVFVVCQPGRFLMHKEYETSLWSAGSQSLFRTVITADGESSTVESKLPRFATTPQEAFNLLYPETAAP